VKPVRVGALIVSFFVFSLTLGCSPTEPTQSLQFDPVKLPAAQVGVTYEATVTVQRNVTPVFSMGVAQGTLPSGLALEYHKYDNSARITGTPTNAGTFKFKVFAWCLGTNVSGQEGEMDYVIEVS
jgi:hypothetical protein